MSPMHEHRFSYPTVVPLGPTTIDAHRSYGHASTQGSLVGAGTESTPPTAHAHVGDAAAAESPAR